MTESLKETDSSEAFNSTPFKITSDHFNRSVSTILISSTKCQSRYCRPASLLMEDVYSLKLIVLMLSCYL